MTAEIRRAVAQVAIFLAGEGLVFFLYQEHDARFHWFVHFFAGGSLALLLMAWLAYWAHRRILWPLVWVFAGHVFGALPDILFRFASVLHAPWMDVFQWHVSAHFMPGRNWTWYGIFMVSLGLYLVALGAVARKSSAPPGVL